MVGVDVVTSVQRYLRELLWREKLETIVCETLSAVTKISCTFQGKPIAHSIQTSSSMWLHLLFKPQDHTPFSPLIIVSRSLYKMLDYEGIEYGVLPHTKVPV